MRQYGLALVIVALLEVIVFWGYFLGTQSPPWDFFGAYTAEAHAYWRDLRLSALDGGWVPYEYAGYPGGIAVQNSAWYLPVALVALVFDYTTRTASVLQALHIGFGAFGAFVLARRLGLRFGAQLFASTAYFFVAPFYSNAEHLDIVRAMAWLPWVVWCCSPLFPWHRRWAIPVAVLILWQTVAGSYPGMLVAMVYTVVFLVVGFQWSRRPKLKKYILPLAWAVVAAALLSVPKYLPMALLRDSSYVSGDTSAFPPRMIYTFFFGYTGPDLPNDPTMRPFFVPVVCFALIALIGLWRKTMVPLLAMGLGAVVFGIPLLPWYDASAALPLMSLSRMRMGCFRGILLFCLVMVAAMVASRLLEGAAAGLRRPALVACGSGLATWLAVMAVAATRWEPPPGTRRLPLILAALATVAVVWALARRPRIGAVGRARQAAVVLMVLGVVSGLDWLFANAYPPQVGLLPWRVDRPAAEVATWGVTADELIALYPGRQTLTQRPGRQGLSENGGWISYSYDSAYYTGRDTLGGTANLKGQLAREAMVAATADPATRDAALELLAAPGVAVAVSGPGALPPSATVRDCVAKGSCGEGLEVAPLSYRPGDIAYRITAASDTVVLFNEAHYPGWSLQLCPSGPGEGTQMDEGCRVVETGLGGAGLVEAVVPAGRWQARLTYALPHWNTYLWIFAAGLVLTLAAPAQRLLQECRQAARSAR
jgi:hypothetical protein